MNYVNLILWVSHRTINAKSIFCCPHVENLNHNQWIRCQFWRFVFDMGLFYKAMLMEEFGLGVDDIIVELIPNIGSWFRISYPVWNLVAKWQQINRGNFCGNRLANSNLFLTAFRDFVQKVLCYF